MMMPLKIVRFEQDIQGARGAFLVHDRFFCFCLEPDNNDAVRSQIPAGKNYLCKRFSSEKHPNTFEVVVPGHSAVLFHTGNTEEDTLMCILLGYQLGTLGGARAVLQSKPAFKAFMDLMVGYKYAAIKIIDAFG